MAAKFGVWFNFQLLNCNIAEYVLLFKSINDFGKYR